MPYCIEEDLLLNSVQLSSSLSRVKYVTDASDEIDSYLGWRYVTPVDVTETSPVPRPIRLTLKRLNIHLATGRLIMAAAMSAEEDSLHAYGKSLVDGAVRTLVEMATGDILPGVPQEEGTDRKLSGGPLISVPDQPGSPVEEFYNRFTRTPYPPYVPYRRWYY